MKFALWMVLLVVLSVACSGPKSTDAPKEDLTQIEQPQDELLADTSETGVEETNTNTDQPIVEDLSNLSDEPQNVSSSPEVITPPPAPVEENVSSVREYQVGENETLMMVAFKIYGNYEMWKKLATENSTLFKGHHNLKKGMILKYTAPKEEFKWSPEGAPYLIKTGDTLGRISNKVYKTPKKWKQIWENNRPLIRNPNKIFAGFTLYYIENARDVASGN